jgi:hypothetical protein
MVRFDMGSNWAAALVDECFGVVHPRLPDDPVGGNSDLDDVEQIRRGFVSHLTSP